VTVYVPVGVVDPTLTVSVDEPPLETELALSVAVTPAGVVVERFTVWATPLLVAVLMVDLPEEPCPMARLFGFAEIVKSLDVTVSVRFVERVALALVPVTVMVYGPVRTPKPVVSVKVDELPAVTDCGLKLAAIPLGVAALS
jgi:hypothetical protein